MCGFVTALVIENIAKCLTEQAGSYVRHHHHHPTRVSFLIHQSLFLPLLFIRWKVPLLSQLIGWLTLWSRNCDVTVLLLTADVFNQSADLALHLTTTTAWHIRRKSFESAMCVGVSECEESDSGLDIITPIRVLYGKKAFEYIGLGICQPYKLKVKGNSYAN